jgi:hypothetical protein
MEELQPPDLAIWRVEKVDFSIITKYKSKTMVLYPSPIGVQRAEEQRKQSPFEEMAAILLRTSEILKSNHTGAS